MYRFFTYIGQLEEVDGPQSPLFLFHITSNHLLHALTPGFRVTIAGKNWMTNVEREKRATPADGEDFASGCMLQPHAFTPNPPHIFSRGQQNSPNHLFIFVCYPILYHPISSFIQQSNHPLSHLWLHINIVVDISRHLWMSN